MTKPVFWKDEGACEVVSRELRAGRLVLGDSDTVLGLYACVSQEGFYALNDCKGRSEKPYLLLVASALKALSLIEAPPAASVVRLMEHCWPGPLTLICKPRADLPAYVKGRGGDSIAIRVPDHEGLRQLLEQCEMLFSTSANKTGQPVPDSLDNVDHTIIASVGCLVLNERAHGPENDRGDKLGTQGHPGSTVASTILDCTASSVRLIREGAYPVSLIQSRSGIVVE